MGQYNMSLVAREFIIGVSNQVWFKADCSATETKMLKYFMKQI